jgi:hypothetical protein
MTDRDCMVTKMIILPFDDQNVKGTTSCWMVTEISLVTFIAQLNLVVIKPILLPSRMLNLFQGFKSSKCP